MSIKWKNIINSNFQSPFIHRYFYTVFNITAHEKKSAKWY
jgi:hypothetical protein